jgi:hypothetical protein
MSLKKFQFSLLILIPFFAGYFLYLNMNSPKMIRPSFHGINVSEFSSHGIVDRVILLKARTSDVNNLAESETAKISVDITLPFDFDDQLQYKWILGQKVFLSEGNLTGSVKNFKKDTPQSIQISVRGYNSFNNRHIGLEVSGLKNNRRIYSDLLISSQQEKSFENTVKNVERIKSQKSGFRK